eukprot:g60068.t1
MLRGYSPEFQALLGTLFTWGVTALGAGIVFIVPQDLSAATQRTVMDLALGFSAGVMLAASFWSLLAPAIELATETALFGGAWAWVPAALSFLLGGGFVYGCNALLPEQSVVDFANAPAGPRRSSGRHKKTDEVDRAGKLRRRRTPTGRDEDVYSKWGEASKASDELVASARRILLLVLAITVHNLPEGLAVGVGFGAVGAGYAGASFEAARTLTIGIGLQNFPEGLAVSLPLMRLGFSPWQSFFYGQLSGMVEPVAGFLGAFLVGMASPILPWALGFAAGAMIFVVVDDIIPEAHLGRDKNPVASLGVMLGFIIMMALDVGLG